MGVEVPVRVPILPKAADTGTHIQVHESSVHISPTDLKSATDMIKTGRPAAEDEFTLGLPRRIAITGSPEIAFKVAVKTLVEPSVTETALGDIQTHPMTDAIKIDPTP